MKTIFRVLLAVICLVSAATFTYGQTNSFTGAVNQSWSDPGNWSLGTVPTSSQLVILPSGTIVRIGSGVNAVAAGMIFSGTLNDSLVIESGGNLTSVGTSIGVGIRFDGVILVESGGTINSSAPGGRGMWFRFSSASLVNNGTITLGGGTGIEYGGGTHHFENNGTLSYTGPSSTSDFFYFNTGANSVPPTITNNGAMRSNGDIAIRPSNTGGNWVNNGILEVSAIAVNDYQAGASSSLFVRGNHTNISVPGGAINPGYETQGSPFGSLAASDLSNTQVTLEIGALNSSDQIGTTNGGTWGSGAIVDVILVNGYVPDSGDVFQIIDNGGGSPGSPASINLPSSYVWTVLQDTPGAGDVSIRFQGLPTPVPTLSQWGMIILTLLVLCMGAITIWNRRFAVSG